MNNTNNPIITKKLKQIENVINQKILNINDLRGVAWNGLPYGKNKLIYLEKKTLNIEQKYGDYF